MVTLTEQENGNLLISLDDKEELQDVISRKQDERDALFDILERSGLIGNGWGVIFEAGLTEAPVIGYDLDIDEDNGDIVSADKIWYYNEYMIKDFLAELKRNGEVVFTGHEDNVK